VVQEIDSLELERRLHGGEVLLLDIRTDGEVARGILPQARHLPMQQIPASLEDLPRDQAVVLYCHSGVRSYHACVFLMGQGFDNVINLRGGILDWARRGLQVVPPA
jgi:rhodanese-related sulfurtransferase